MMIFHSFVKQAKINVRNDKNFKEANEILEVHKPKGYVPRSPHKFLGIIYGKKGVIVFGSSLLSVIALGQALLTFDFASFISYLLTIIMGCVFGYLTMKQNELYWTSEYLDYAKKILKENTERENKEKLELAEKERTEQINAFVGPDKRTNILVSLDCFRYLGNNSK